MDKKEEFNSKKKNSFVLLKKSQYLVKKVCYHLYIFAQSSDLLFPSHARVNFSIIWFARSSFFFVYELWVRVIYTWNKLIWKIKIFSLPIEFFEIFVTLSSSSSTQKSAKAKLVRFSGCYSHMFNLQS